MSTKVFAKDWSSARLTRRRNNTMFAVTPARVGPLGGGVLLLHGEALPFLSLQQARASIYVGDASCPFLPRRSDPRGAFLACTIPARDSHDSHSEDDESVVVTIRGAAGAQLSCPKCNLTYVPALRATASLALSQLRGAAGDVVTMLGVGDWPLLESSQGMHEQVEVMVGGHAALPRHPSSTAVSRVAPTEGSWRVELSLPSITAGTYRLTAVLDRLWRDIHDIHGTVEIDGSPHAAVTILPMVQEVQPRRSSWR